MTRFRALNVFNRFTVAFSILALSLLVQYLVTRTGNTITTYNVQHTSIGHPPHSYSGSDMVTIQEYRNAAAKIHCFLVDEDLTGMESPSVLGLRRSTQRKTRQSLKRISEALDRFRLDEISISFNGGKDCLVMLYLYMAVLGDRDLIFQRADIENNKNASVPNGKQSNEAHNSSYTIYSSSQRPPENGSGDNSLAESSPNLLKINAVYIYYEQTFPEIEAFNHETVRAYNMHLQTYSNCQLKDGFARYLEDHPSIRAVIVGNRRTDPYSADLATFHPTDNDWPAFVRVHPILDWTYEEVWCFLLGVGVRYCRLYDQGYTSIGGVASTVPNPYLLKQDYEEKNKGWIKPDNLRWLQHKFEENNKGVADNKLKDINNQDYYPAFYLQNDIYERYSRKKH